MTTTTRSMIFTGPREGLKLRSQQLPTIGHGQILVKITCCTLCGSDLHSYSGRRSCPVPTVLGHEMIGQIVEMGRDAETFDIIGKPLCLGDRVTWSIAASCGECFYCQNDIPQKCESLFKYGHQQIDDASNLSGGLAEHCLLVAGTSIVKIPAGIPDEVVSPANCATATVAGALRTADGCRGKSVLIMGSGMLGLTASAMARHAGAVNVIVSDIDSGRLELSRSFGATETIVGGNDLAGFATLVRQYTKGRGADLAIEVTGNPQATQSALHALRIGGQAVLVGAVYPEQPVEFDAELIVRRLLRIDGLHNYRADDLAAAVCFLEETHKMYPFAKLVAKRYSLADANRAFAEAIKTRPFRVMVCPGASSDT